MESKLKLSEIYDKNINFIIGSGASHGLFPLLKVALKGNDNSEQTIETIATKFENNSNTNTLLFMHYYKMCIEPILSFDYSKTKTDKKGKSVIENYEKFIRTILYILKKKKNNDRRICNVFTTNYDGCLVHTVDEVIKDSPEEFILNDGARGFFRRYLSAKNYNSYTKQSGTFDRYSTQLPQINLIPLHGSGAWVKDEESIQVNYSSQTALIQACTDLIPDISSFSDCLNDSTKKTADLEKINIADLKVSQFWEAYKKLPIVNPTKWKFHETVFEEHYYQMLRHLSYELERPNTILITFGFSFADEHILNLVKRSLANPSLQLFVSCFDKKEYDILSKRFEKFNNVTFLTDENVLDFTKFNSDFFTAEPKDNSPIGGTA